MIKQFIDKNKTLVFDTLKELCLIPAPSHNEEKRASYCKEWLEKTGAKGVYIDDALNVVYPVNCENSDEITVIVAHTDTVFPDTEPMPYFDDGEKVHCPGASDDTASVVVLLLMAKYLIENNIVPQKGLLLVCNSCEEGLGNLKGTRQIFKDYEGRIARFISYDSSLNVVNDHCVGSHRYEVEVTTKGGHSFLAFGNENAIAELSKIITWIYEIKVPEKENCHTTYNVGTMSGGTSVNTICQSAKMLCEYRSDDLECLDIMKKNFEEIFEKAQKKDVTVKVTKIGDRPCADIDFSRIEELKKIVVPIIEEVTGENISFNPSSTDCNIPLSLGVPALCIGVNNHEGMHAREEWVDKNSILKGLEIAIKTTMEFCL